MIDTITVSRLSILAEGPRVKWEIPCTMANAYRFAGCELTGVDVVTSPQDFSNPEFKKVSEYLKDRVRSPK